MFKKCFTAFLILSVAIGGMAFAGGSSELAVSESGLPIIRNTRPSKKRSSVETPRRPSSSNG